jgi:WD40 repeat protein
LAQGRHSFSDSIERSDVIDALVEALRTNTYGWFLVLGGPGTGKTVILEQLIARLTQDEAWAGTLMVEHRIQRRRSTATQWQDLWDQLASEVHRRSGSPAIQSADFAQTLERLAAKEQSVLLVIDGLDALPDDGEWPEILLRRELVPGLRILGASRQTNHLAELQAAGPKCVVDLDSKQWKESNRMLVRRYWDRERERASQEPKGRAAQVFTAAFVATALHATDGQIDYAVAVRDWRINAERPELDLSSTELPRNPGEFLQKAWQDVLRRPGATAEERDMLTLGFGLLCVAREPLTRGLLMAVTRWKPYVCDDFLELGGMLLKKSVGQNTPEFSLYSDAHRKHLEDYLGFKSLSESHQAFADVCDEVEVARSKGLDEVEGEVNQELRAFAARNHVYHLLQSSKSTKAWALVTDVRYLVWVACIAGIGAARETLGMAAAASQGSERQLRMQAYAGLAQHAFRLEGASHDEITTFLPSILFNGLAAQSWQEKEIEKVFRFRDLPPVLRLRRPAQSTLGWKYAFSSSRREIRDMAVTPDSARIGLVDRNGSISTYSLTSGEAEESPSERNADFVLAALANESSDILGVTAQNEVFLQRYEDDRPVGVGRHEARVNACVIDPKGNTGVTADETGMVRVWDLKRGAEKQAWRANKAVKAVAIGRVSGCVAVGCESGPVTVVANGQGHVVSTDEFVVRALAIDTSEKVLAVAQKAGDMSLLELPTLEPLRSWKAHAGTVHACTFTEDGATLVSGGADRTVAVWSDNGKKIRRLRGHLFKIMKIDATRDGKHVVSAATNGTMLAWDMKAVLESTEPSPWLDCRIVRPTPRPDRAGNTPLACIASVSEDARLHVWRNTEKGVDRQVLGPAQFYTCALSHDGTSVAGGTSIGRVIRFDVESGEQKGSVKAHDGRIRDCAWAPDSDFVATTGEDRKVVISSASRTESLLMKHRAEVRTCTFVRTREGTRLVSADSSGEVLVWDVAKGRHVETYRAPSPVTSCKAITFECVGLACEDGSFIVWRLGQAPEVLFKQPSALFDVTAAGLGDHVITAGRDEALFVWRLADKKCVGKVYGPAIINCIDAEDDVVVAGDAMGNFYILELVVGGSRAVAGTA